MADKVVGVTLVARTAAYQAQMRQAAASNAQFGASAGVASGKSAKMAGGLRGMATSAGLLNPALLGAGGLVMGVKAVVGAAVEWESAFTGVEKTVDGTAEQMAALSDGLRDMSGEIPTTAVELASIAEAAGQLGIETDSVLEFTRVMADLGEATNMTANDAATALARLANITQMSQDDFDRLGSTVVELGNNLATTEAEIVEMGLRLAGAGAQVGLTEADILALAGALSSVGIQAQAGGTAFSKVMIEMSQATEDGGEKLQKFADVAGMTADQFATMFRENPTEAIIAFVEGLGAASDAGENLFGILGDLGIEEIRMRDALLRTAGAGDVLRESVDMASGAWEQNIALTEEAERRYDTMASKWDILKNNFKDLSVTIGDETVPVVSRLLDHLNENFQEGSIGNKFFTGDFAGAIADLNHELTGFDYSTAALVRFEEQTNVTAEMTDMFVSSLEGATVASRDTTGAVEGTDGAVEGLGESAYTTADGVFELSRLLDDLFGAAMDVEQAAIRLEQGWEDVTEALKENGTTLDINTEKGRANRQAILDQSSAIRDDIEARYAQGDSLADIAVRYDQHVGQLRDVMSQAGMTEDQIDDYIDTLGLTPESVVTDIIAEDRASSIIGNVIRMLGRVPKVTRVSIETTRKYNDVYGGKISGARAHGGPVSAGHAYLVGEDGPEVVTMPNAGYVHDATTTAAMMAGGGVGTAVAGATATNVTINVSALNAQDAGDAVFDALKDYQRRNGPLPLRVNL